MAADGCDPAFRSADVDGIAAALAEVPALLEDAEARWREQPTHATGPAPGGAAAPPTGQLPLFG